MTSNCKHSRSSTSYSETLSMLLFANLLLYKQKYYRLTIIESSYTTDFDTLVVAISLEKFPRFMRFIADYET